MKPARRFPIRRLIHAFSLVEVVLALGLISFAMLSMLSLLPMGFKTFEEASSLTTETEIAQRLVGQFQLGGYTNILAGGAATQYFTADGLPTNAAGSFYTVEIDPAAGIALPGAAAGSASANVVSVIFHISRRNSPQTTNAIPAFIANTGT